MNNRDEYDDKKDQMSPEEIAKFFDEKTPEEKKTLPNLSMMSSSEIETWEKEQLNSNDIYRISARVKNLARSGGGSLTPVGEVLCNTFIHVLKDLYDFAETLPEQQKAELIERIKKHEDMPANVINASKANVKVKK